MLLTYRMCYWWTGHCLVWKKMCNQFQLQALCSDVDLGRSSRSLCSCLDNMSIWPLIMFELRQTEILNYFIGRYNCVACVSVPHTLILHDAAREHHAKICCWCYWLELKKKLEMVFKPLRLLRIFVIFGIPTGVKKILVLKTWRVNWGKKDTHPGACTLLASCWTLDSCTVWFHLTEELNDEHTATMSMSCVVIS